MAEVIYVSIDYMSEYMYNDGIGDLSHHRLSMSAYILNVGKGDLCQHMLSMSLYMFIDDIGDLYQHRLYDRIHEQYWHW